uniref:Putative secreted protein n=1 Tax=Panstrongylus lignarius TaxID=156445 RepID=A0A224XPU6_9HEMI
MALQPPSSAWTSSRISFLILGLSSRLIFAFIPIFLQHSFSWLGCQSLPFYLEFYTIGPSNPRFDLKKNKGTRLCSSNISRVSLPYFPRHSGSSHSSVLDHSIHLHNRVLLPKRVT